MVYFLINLNFNKVLNEWAIKHLGILRITLIALGIMLLFLLIWEFVAFLNKIKTKRSLVAYEPITKEAVLDKVPVSTIKEEAPPDTVQATDSDMVSLESEPASETETVDTESDVWQRLIEKSIREKPSMSKSPRTLEVISEDTSSPKDSPPITGESEAKTNTEAEQPESSNDSEPKEF